MNENIESVEVQKSCDKIPYNYERINNEILKVRQKEYNEEPRKRPWHDLSPSDPIILSKFWYKSWADVPVGQ